MPVMVLDNATLSDNQFNQISDLVRSVCGINLHDGKKELVKARLAKQLRHKGINSFDEYIERVRNDRSGIELTKMLDVLSTNLTYFFREPQHFDYLRKSLLPAVLRRNREQSKLRIWSAGCSTGEEPYSIGILLREEFASLSRWDVRILATDLSTAVLETAKAGIYPRERLGELPAAMVGRQFVPDTQGLRPATYRISPAIRSLVSFGRLNLMEKWPMHGPFDVIFCRNVMIYFDKPTQARLVGRFWDILSPGGCLFVGHSESLSGITHRFRYVEPAVYAKS